MLYTTRRMTGMIESSRDEQSSRVNALLRRASRASPPLQGDACHERLGRLQLLRRMARRSRSAIPLSGALKSCGCYIKAEPQLAPNLCSASSRPPPCMVHTRLYCTHSHSRQATVTARPPVYPVWTLRGSRSIAKQCSINNVAALSGKRCEREGAKLINGFRRSDLRPRAFAQGRSRQSP